mgnify:CR=1 FL=1
MTNAQYADAHHIETGHHVVMKACETGLVAQSVMGPQIAEREVWYECEDCPEKSGKDIRPGAHE